MKKIIVGLILIVSGVTIVTGQSDFRKILSEYEEKGLSHKALNVVDSVLNSNPSAVDYLYAVDYRLKLLPQLYELDPNRLFDTLQKHQNSAPAKALPLLNLMEAQFLVNYYQSNQWKIDQKEDDGLNNAVLEEWSRHDFISAVKRCFVKAIDEAVQQKLMLNEFSEFFSVDGYYVRFFPTLADQMFFQATLLYRGFESGKWDLPELVIESVAEDDVPSEVGKQVLQWYWQWWKLNEGSESIRGYIELNRLQWIHSVNISFQRMELYERHLRALYQKYSNFDVAADVLMALAMHFYTLSANYSAFDTVAVKYYPTLQQAREMAQKAMKEYPESAAAKNANEMLAAIEKPYLAVSMEQYQIARQAIPIGIVFSNLKRVELLVKKVPTEAVFRQRELRDYLNAPTIYKTTIDLPTIDDFYRHTTRAVISSLDAGGYVLELNADGAEPVLVGFLVSGLNAMVEQQQSENVNLWLVDRWTGEPIKKAVCEVLVSRYNRKAATDRFEVLERIDINNGLATVGMKKLSSATVLRFISAGDTLWQYNSLPFSTGLLQTVDRVQMFTDRAIYRPGQNIALKGIWYRGDGEQWKVVPGQKLTLTVRDDNYREIKRYDVNTNEFGSFELTIPIPADVKPGYLSINCPFGGHAVRVEYYRRYSFDGVFKPTRKVIFPGDLVEILFSAKTFSGVDLKQFKIVGEVKFSTRRAWWLPVSEKTVAVWDTVIGNEGQFLIRFATPKNIDYQQYFINLTATLPSGESRNFSHSFIVSENPFELTVDKNFWVIGESLPQIKLRTINGEAFDQRVTVVIERLRQPERVLVPLALPRADKPLLSYAEWVRQLPFAPYDNENDPATWQVDRVVVRENMNANALAIPNDVVQQLSEGTYRITINAMDRSLIEHFTVINPGDRKLLVTELFEVYLSKSAAKPGETVTVTMVSSVDNLPVWYGITAGNKTIEQKRVALRKGKQTVTIPITPNYEGQIFFNAVAGKFGTMVLKNRTVSVEPLSRKIDVDVVSMRNRIEPGSEQQWTFRISTPDKRPLEAEVMASMYDRSLDVFVPKPKPQFQVWYRQINTTGYAANINRTISDQTAVPYFYFAQPIPLQWRFSVFSGSVDFYFPSPNTKFRSGQKFTKGTTMELAMTNAEEGGNKALQNEEPSFAEATQKSEAVFSGMGVQKLRSNFNETAFFYPQLVPDDKGVFSVKFETPDALTGWNFELFAHDKQLGSGYYKAEIETRLPFMVTPLFPRLAYTGDSLMVLVMVMNQTDSAMTVEPGCEVENIKGQKLAVDVGPKAIRLAPNTESSFRVTLAVPTTPGALAIKVYAKAGNYTDGEETLIPVYPNRQLVINTVSLWGKPESTTEFSFKELLPESNREEKSLTMTLELSTNPTWYAIQSLPFFDNPDSKSAFSLIESLFAVQTANLLIERFPEIKTVLQAWTTTEAKSLVSKLESNSTMKIADLEKTPWFYQAQSETERMRKVALFLDKNKVNYLTNFTLVNLQKLQTSSGGFSWVPGWHPSFYVTLYVSEHVGRLLNMNSVLQQNQPEIKELNMQAIAYLTDEVETMFRDLIASKVDTADYTTPYTVLRFLYVKSLNDENYRPTSRAEQYFYQHARRRWQSYNLYGRAVLGIVARRIGDIKTATAILKAFDGSSVVSSEKGLFWRENVRGWEWYQAPIATQVQIMEFYQTMQASTDRLDAMKIWLLHHKQTHMWNDGAATVQAVYALTTTGRNWLRNQSPVIIKLDNLTISSNEVRKQSGTGQFTTNIDWQQINPLKGKGMLQNPNSNPVYGGLYAQYFETFENIPSWQHDLSIDAQYFTVLSIDGELRIRPIEESQLKTGDKVRVRLTISSKRELEFVIVRLPFAACFEPAQMLSGYGQTGGEWYYVENYDDRSDFYFYRLRQGVTVLEFDLYVLRSGNYSAAPATVQSLYAPEFLGRAQGKRFSPKP